MAAIRSSLGQVGVPDVHRAHLRELRHRLAVGPHRGERHVARVGLREAVVARRDREAGGHPLDVVLERAGQRLVEVVQIEQQRSLGRCEQAEVRQVGVAAELGEEAGPRRVLEIGRHDLGRAPIERERRHHHPPVADRHQVGLARRVLLLEQCHGIGPVGGRRPLGVAGRGYFLPRCLAVSPFIDAWVLNLATLMILTTPFQSSLFLSLDPGGATSSMSDDLRPPPQSSAFAFCVSYSSAVILPSSRSVASFATSSAAEYPAARRCRS